MSWDSHFHCQPLIRCGIMGVKKNIVPSGDIIMIDTSGLNLTPDPRLKGPPTGQAQPMKEPAEKRYPLEGVSDIYEGIPGQHSASDSEDPVYLTLGTKLFPALDILKETMELLGKKPSPEEVDRSNVRRIIRAFTPVVEAFSMCYDEKDLENAMDHISDLADSLGNYKDASVIESVIRDTVPGGQIPGKLKGELEKDRARRSKKFGETYDHFRKKGMNKAMKVLYHPERLSHLSPEKLLKRDREIMARAVKEQASGMKSHGLIHHDPKEFHEARKNLRTFVYAVKAATDLFDFEKRDIEAMSNQTLIFGLAQDSYTAYAWLKKKGFDREADLVLRRYDTQKQDALEGAEKLASSGVFEHIQGKLS